VSSSSCIYEGTVRHRRRRPTEHGFRYTVFMLYLDLAELPGALDHRVLWSARRRALARFRRADYPGSPGQPLDAWVRDLVEQRTGARPTGPVRLLTHLRYLGVWFNPISVYYCFAPDGRTLEWAVLEVTNTPWRDRHHYVLDIRGEGAAATASGVMAKEMHVSPFLPMDLRYQWRLNRPGSGLGLAVDVLDDTGVIVETSLAMRRRQLSRRVMATMLLRHPPMSLRVLAGIHWQAILLWRKGTPYHRRPRDVAEERAAA
jgi:DUF1365 family protein